VTKNLPSDDHLAQHSDDDCTAKDGVVYLMYSAGATFSAHLTGIADEIFDAVNFSKAALKRNTTKLV
jgi:hypothetical protein